MSHQIEKVLESIAEGNRNLSQLFALYPHVSGDIIRTQLDRALVADDVGLGIRDIGLLKQLHPSMDIDEIQQILLESLINRGETNSVFLHSLCPDISRGSIQHSITAHKVTTTQSLVASRSSKARVYMDEPIEGIADRRPIGGWQNSGHGTRHSKSHYSH